MRSRRWTARALQAAAIALLVFAGERAAWSLPASYIHTDDCCNYQYSGSCVARPNHPDPQCRAGHAGAGMDPDLFCSGCIGNAGECLPDIPTGSVQDIPNGIDDDCDGVVDAQFGGTVDDLTIKTTSCCHHRFRDRCDARPNHPDQRCKAGRLAAGDDPDFFCGGCFVDPNVCIPDIETGQLAEIANGQDDDCDGFVDDEQCDGVDNDGDGLIDEDEGSCLAKFLFVPLCFNGDQAAFEATVDNELHYFYDRLNLTTCSQNFSRHLLQVSQINLPCLGANDKICTVEMNKMLDQVRNFLAAGGPGLGNFSQIIALTNQDICGATAGANNNALIWAETGGVPAHEIGHSYGLADEYCSTEAGGPAPCNSPTSINRLGADLGCDPRANQGCCGTCTGYGICCEGNVNPVGGRCIMSYANAPGPRTYCDRCFSQFTSPTNPRSPTNPNGRMPLSCAHAHIGQRSILTMQYAVTQAGQPLLQFSSIGPGRVPMAGENDSGQYTTEVKTESGTLLFRTSYDLTFGPRNLHAPYTPIGPISDRQDVGFRAAIPDTITPTDKLKIVVLKDGTPTGQTTMNGAAPSANAGPDQVRECVAGGATVTLSGAASSDADGDSLNYTWSAPGVTLTTPNAQTTTGTFPKGTTIVTLVVTDGLLTSTDTVTVTVSDTTAPTLVVPGDITITTCTNADIGQGQAGDSCGAATVGSNRPAKFPIGPTNVTWTATDAAGNQLTGIQKVTAELADDPSCCPTGTVIIQGTSMGQTLIGTASNECILGMGGHDTIQGGGGQDFISGGAGNDTITGGSVHDYIWGGPGLDSIDAAGGNDFVDGGNDTDNCSGGTGTNSMRACETASFCNASCCGPNNCTVPTHPPLGCQPAYVKANCGSYVQGIRVSRNGRNWECTNGNCSNCATFTSCEPGNSGCPWGVVWTDRGACP